VLPIFVQSCKLRKQTWKLELLHIKDKFFKANCTFDRATRFKHRACLLKKKKDSIYFLFKLWNQSGNLRSQLYLKS